MNMFISLVGVINIFQQNLMIHKQEILYNKQSGF